MTARVPVDGSRLMLAGYLTILTSSSPLQHRTTGVFALGGFSLGAWCPGVDFWHFALGVRSGGTALRSCKCWRGVLAATKCCSVLQRVWQAVAAAGAGAAVKRASGKKLPGSCCPPEKRPLQSAQNTLRGQDRQQ
eukprot:CAMPEP_0174322714 /NCGR_PEP_ID=MMETSP0810-20121108/11212_1 /TAXON_ID=73025 ORGANISM="Eutreptiella gymnastica-like, Strain CCMP1594" /NCGR_SAMPLE_ID=MMETSP0810 /ASSEMBLY_ACC=CAM_ASM_000659 /LENGTH=134 /DNA_ID=CAMNT_0015434675 /DNA_START=167 /DNA_END=572 /DNA_ORIENTATION=+